MFHLTRAVAIWPPLRALLALDIESGVVPIAVAAVCVAVIVILVARRRSPSGVVVVLVSVVGSAAIGLGIVALANAQFWFGVDLDLVTAVLVAITFGALGLAVQSVVAARSWRRGVAIAAIPILLIGGTVAVNAHFGLDSTIADLAGISIDTPVKVPRIHVTPTASAPPEALWQSWHAPAGMPAVGEQEHVVIPPTASHFVSRPAGLYLPPAALVAHPPVLPLVIMMMGQPGNPDPSFAASVLDPMAARHQGLAPIVLVVDQLGNPAIDPLCLNTAAHGNAETFLTQDVVAWVRTHLRVDQDAAHWVVAGYSNGGECALSFGVKYPQIWGNVLDISGEDYPGEDSPARTLATVFHHDLAAYRATYPLPQLEQHSYPDTTAVFTAGTNDAIYAAEAKIADVATAAAGWHDTLDLIPNAGHVKGAVIGGLQDGFDVLYPVLGLSGS